MIIFVNEQKEKKNNHEKYMKMQLKRFRETRNKERCISF